MNYALKLDNVCKTYETSDFLLDNVSFEVPMGSVMGFVGENGAGKTTTIGCILNTLFRNSGSIQIFEKEMKDEDTVLRNDIGVVYDGDNFPKYLTAKQISEIMQGIFSQWDNSLFQKYLKISPSQYLQQYRLSKACTLLRKTSLSITDISYTVGFQHAPYFTKLFTQYIGETPSEYRKEYMRFGEDSFS